jgi:hypothetical protein
MVFFGFSAIYLVPISSFLFVSIFLKAIEKIVNKDKYTTQLSWSGIFFALTLWSISASSSIH